MLPHRSRDFIALPALLWIVQLCGLNVPALLDGFYRHHFWTLATSYGSTYQLRTLGFASAELPASCHPLRQGL